MATSSLLSVAKKCSYLKMPWDFWLIFIFLGIIVPWRGRVRLQHLLARPSLDSKERIVLYGSTIAFQWVCASVVAWRAFARGMTPAQLALGATPTATIWIASIFGAAAVGLLHALNLRRIANLEVPSVDRIKRLANRLLPQSPIELAPYCALAVTAGLCEEFLYRGFAMATLTTVGLPNWAVLLVSSALFGLAHAYQGASGVVGTFVLGVLFALARLACNSLVPPMVWHSAVDLVAGIAGAKYLIRRPVMT